MKNKIIKRVLYSLLALIVIFLSALAWWSSQFVEYEKYREDTYIKSINADESNSLNLQASYPHNVFTVKKVGKLDVIITTVEELIVVFDGKNAHVFPAGGAGGLFAITNNNIKIDGFDGEIYTKDDATSGDGRGWIESQGIVHLRDVTTLSIPGHPNKVIGIISNSFGTAGGSYTLYLIDVETGEISSEKSLDVGHNKITKF